MRRVIFIAIALMVAVSSVAQSKYNLRKRSMFEALPIKSSDIVFLGNSITDGGEWRELFDNKHIKNRGISGDRSGWMVERIDTILAGQPKRLFVMIGINDLAAGIEPEVIVENLRSMIKRFKQSSRWTDIYIQSILPVNGRDFTDYKRHYAISDKIVPTNELLKELCEEGGAYYIDLYPLFVNEDGLLDERYTNDGLHLMGEAYVEWAKAIKQYVR